MKNLKVVIVILLSLFVITGCKKQTQKEFVEELTKQNEMNAGEFSMEINKLSIEGDDMDAPTRASLEMAAKMITGTKVSGDYLKDTEKNLLNMTLAFDLLGQKIPLEFFVDQKQPAFYMSTDFLPEVIAIAKEFNTELPIETKDFEQLTGKYLHITEEDLEKQANNQKKAVSLSGINDSKLFREYLETLEPDFFEEKGDTIKGTFTKKDLQAFIKYAEEKGDKDEKQAAKELSGNLKQLTKYEQTTTVNMKKHSQKTKVKLTAKSEGIAVALNLTINNQAKETKQKVKLPKTAETVSMEQLEEIFASVEEKNSLISEADFNDLLATIQSERAHLTQTQIEEIKQTYQPYLTDEQYKQLEEVLSQTNELAA